jgi:tripartite-type tricarboxylate transporter receptor subunit TctC
MLTRWLPGIFSLALALTVQGAVAADTWPTKPITIVVATSAGGGFDLMARMTAPGLSQQLGVPVAVMNREGGSELIGSAYLLGQPHDGNTILVVGSVPYWYADIYEFHAPFKMSDFDVLNIQSEDRSAVMVPKNSRFKSLKDLIAEITAHPGTLSGAVVRSSGEFYNMGILREALGLPPSAIRVVTYESSTPLRSALAGSQVDFAVVSLDASASIIQLLTPLAIFGPPVRDFPNLPSVESVLKPMGKSATFVPSSYRAFVVPADFKTLYPDRYKKLLAAYKTVVQSPELIAKANAASLPAQWIGPEKSRAEIESAFALLKRHENLLTEK